MKMAAPLQSARTLNPPKKIGIDFGQDSPNEDQGEKVKSKRTGHAKFLLEEEEEEDGWGDWAAFETAPKPVPQV